jgi:hypothetical protein
MGYTGQFWVLRSNNPEKSPTDSDIYTLRVKRLVSVTPLSIDMTSRVDLKELPDNSKMISIDSSTHKRDLRPKPIRALFLYMQQIINCPALRNDFSKHYKYSLSTRVMSVSL